MKKRWKKLSFCILLSLTTLLVGACTKQKVKEAAVTVEPMEAEESYAVSFDLIGGKDVMPVLAYYGPYASTYSEDGQVLPNYITDEYWADMAACGVNVMGHSITNYATSAQQVKKNLDFGEKYHIAVIVDDSNIRNMADRDEISMEEVSEELSKYADHPAFGGIYLLDEPYTSYFSPVDTADRNLYRYEKLAPLLHEKLGVFTYTNMLSSILGQNEFDRYERYLRECCDVLKPPYLMFDRYPFDKVQEGRINRYFYDLAVMRKVSRDYKIPFWTFVQAGSQWNDGMKHFDTEGYYPNEGQFDWNINTALAFGTQGISYFPYIQPYYFAYAESTPFDFERNGMIGAWGNKNRWYYYAQDMSKQIQAIDQVLMNSVSKGVLACGKEATADMGLTKDYDVWLEGDSWRELKSVEGNALIGCFNYQGKTALYVVNYEKEYAQLVNLKFHTDCRMTVTQDGEQQKLQGDGLTLDMAAGEGVLLILEEVK